MRDSILIVVPRRCPAAADRAGEFASALRAGGRTVSVTAATRTRLGELRRCACAITLAPGLAAHLVGYTAQRAGAKWIADIDPSADAHGSIGHRLTLAADALVVSDELRREAVFHDLQASAAVVSADAAEAINRQVDALLEGSRDQLRILMLGPVNSPHMEHLALALRDRGNAVRATGGVWGGGLEPSSLPDSGIPVSPIGTPHVLSVRRLIRRSRPHVVHANWMPFAVLATLAGARPLVAMAWGSDVYLAGRHQLLLYRLVVRRAGLVLADSRALLERLVALGADPERAALFNWGVDLARLKPPDDRAALKRQLGLGEGPLIISARGLKPLYNPQVVLDAFRRVRRTLPNAELIFKHQGDGDDELARFALPEGVRVVGRIRHEQLFDYFRAADVCVSIPDTDSSPRSVWEAMACGCPCVLSDLPWVHEQIRAGEHALVTAVDASDVADAVKRLLGNAELREAIVVQGRKLVEEHHDAAAQIDRLERLYVHLAGRDTYDQSDAEPLGHRR